MLCQLRIDHHHVDILHDLIKTDIIKTYIEYRYHHNKNQNIKKAITKSITGIIFQNLLQI